jgi:hypothetical protein
MQKNGDDIPWREIKNKVKSKLNKLSDESMNSLKDNIELASEKVKSVYRQSKEQAIKELDAFKTTLEGAPEIKTHKQKKAISKKNKGKKQNE